jgi:hypothetical protein
VPDVAVDEAQRKTRLVPAASNVQKVTDCATVE